MRHDFIDYLEDIFDAIEKADSFVTDMTFEQFEFDTRTNFAVVRALEIIGEATKRLPASFRTRHPEIPWKDMAGMRDRISHGYDTVNLAIVWETVQKRLPEIKPQIRDILNNLKNDRLIN